MAQTSTATTTAIAAAPAGLRRISSLRSSTFNFFKSTKSAQSHRAGNIRRNELTISSPIPLAEENVSPTNLIRPLTHSETEPIFAERRSYRTQFCFDTASDRAGSPMRRRRESVAEEVGSEHSITVGMDVRELSPPESRQSDIQHSAVNEKITSPPSARSKKKGAKLKLALSLLRRRSNPNLRKAFTVDPTDERHESNIQRNGIHFNEPLFNPSFMGSNISAPSSHGTPPTVLLTQATPVSRSSGFKFGLNSRSHSSKVLTKPPPLHISRPRRATVASLVFETTPVDPGRPQTTLWPGLQHRPSNSTRSSVATNVLPHAEGLSTSSITGPEHVPGGLHSGTPGGGLFPRPASLQRNWSDSARKQQAHGGSAVERSPEDPDKSRPLSFGGLNNGYGSMKITEAASLESRVRELEAQVATLQNFITQQVQIGPDRRNLSVAAVSAPRKTTLQSPFEERKRSKRRTYSESSTSSSVRLDGLGIPSTPKTKYFPPRTSPGPRETSLDCSPDTLRKREETFHLLEGIKPGSESRRNTSSTVRISKRGSCMEPNSPPQTPAVSMAQHAGLVEQVKREQRARRKLESQVANLQEQMSLVLHRHLLAQSSPAMTSAISTDTGLRPDYTSLRRKASSEVPTPDLTPPRRSPVNHVMDRHLFTGFDSENTVDTDDNENENDESSFFVDGIEAEGSEAWETPAEEKEHLLDNSDNERTFSNSLSPLPSPGARTMSLSQLTHKSSKNVQ